MLKSINRYIINEYMKSLFVVIAVMLSIILLINLLDEFNFFKSKKDLKFIFFLIFTVLKIPNVLINLFPFIVLFAGIVFYLKIYNHNEVISLRVMGYSNYINSCFNFICYWICNCFFNCALLILNA
jgi:lipopolysaccharide export LptBFGC system permease protein LptF